ncbi:GAF domain-containing protein [Candidatus Sumerlaeota bacterium]|nr:GAF domain-containing protein [Candidatus Sumerlaeota bacterium]
MDNQEDRKRLEQSTRIVDALYRVVNFISYVGDLRRLLELVMDESKKVVNAEASSLMLYDPEAEELYFEVALGEKGDAVKKIRLKLGEGIAGISAKERRTIVVNDVSKDPRHFKYADEVTEYKTRNLIATPMLRGERLIGVLEVLNKSNDEPFNDDDIKVLEFFAQQAAIAIENARLIQENLKSERLAAIGQAIASLSHYIKNVISGFEGSVSLVDNALAQKNMEIIDEIWPVFKRSFNRLSRLVRKMLTYSHTTTPQYSIASVNQICRDIYEANKQTAEQANVTLSLALDENIPLILLDTDKIHDAILNLVSNAIEATSEVGSTVEIRTALLPDEKIVEINVSDDGPGIPADVQRRVFEPFFSTKGSKGSGLGLAIVKKNIEEHNGTIRLQSEEGKGTTFIIRLPLRIPESQ